MVLNGDVQTRGYRQLDLQASHGMFMPAARWR
jgi:hypothetical protein